MALTTLADCKTRLGPTVTGSDFDSVLNALIAEVSDKIEHECGRRFSEATRTEYYDGDGLNRLVLREGPLVSIANVWTVDRSTGSEVLTAMASTEFYASGLRTEGYRGNGIIYHRSAWPIGTRNIKVTYLAGFTTIPEALREFATSHVCAMFNRRTISGLISRQVGDGSLTQSIPDTAIDSAFMRAVAPWRSWAYR